MQGKPCLGDFKTSRGIYEDHLLQLAAYGKLWEANEASTSSGPIQYYRAIRFGKDDASLHDHSWPAASMEMPWKAFLRCLELHKLRRSIRGML